MSNNSSTNWGCLIPAGIIEIVICCIWYFNKDSESSWLLQCLKVLAAVIALAAIGTSSSGENSSSPTDKDAEE